MGSDLSVVNAARVSFAKEHIMFEESDAKLISYLAKHNHWSPFGHASATFHISVPIFVARQLVKHQVGLVWNEVSRRYVSDDPVFYMPTQWRGKPTNAKQGSSDAIIELDKVVTGGEGDTQTTLMDEVALQHVFALETYRQLLDAGVAPEQARIVLPLNTMTELWWTGSLQAFARVCNLRLDSHAQSETADVAKLISNEMEKLFPVSWKALMEND